MNSKSELTLLDTCDRHLLSYAALVSPKEKRRNRRRKHTPTYIVHQSGTQSPPQSAQGTPRGKDSAMALESAPGHRYQVCKYNSLCVRSCCATTHSETGPSQDADVVSAAWRAGLPYRPHTNQERAGIGALSRQGSQAQATPLGAPIILGRGRASSPRGPCVPRCGGHC